jgi:hypothetical protein
MLRMTIALEIVDGIFAALLGSHTDDLKIDNRNGSRDRFRNDLRESSAFDFKQGLPIGMTTVY